MQTENRVTVVVYVLALAAFVAAGVLISSIAHAQPADAGPPAAAVWSSTPVRMGGYVAFAGLQALDVASTLKALQQPGTREGNPALAGVVDRPVTFIALKATTTTATLLVMQRFSKHHPKASVLVMAGINSAYLYVVSANFQRAAGP